MFDTVRSCEPCEWWRCVPRPQANEWVGNEADTPIDRVWPVFYYAYTDKMTAAQPGFELDFGLNVVRNESSHTVWLDPVLTDPDHRFYWSNRIVATITIMIVIEHSARHTPTSITHNIISYGEQSFAVSGPTCWNALPSELKLAASTLDHFCSRLKTLTVLFIRSYYAWAQPFITVL